MAWDWDPAAVTVVDYVSSLSRLGIRQSLPWRWGRAPLLMDVCQPLPGIENPGPATSSLFAPSEEEEKREGERDQVSSIWLAL